MSNPIRLTGCRQHNLKGFDLEVPRGQYVVVTGVSGSGKSSLAFDTLFAEGQRRYVESFSAYARQFLERMNRPAIDGVEGIPPAVAIEQGNSVRSSRSTVGTVTEIHDYVKVLFARGGVRHCDRCDRPVLRASPESLADELLARLAGRPVLIGFDAPTAQAEDFPIIVEQLRRQGFVRLLANGAVTRLEELTALPTSGDFLVVLDRIIVEPARRGRLVEALEQAFAHGAGTAVVVALADDGKPGRAERHDTRLRCPDCKIAYADPTPGLFTFNNPIGACPTCRGFGRTIEIAPDLVVPDASKSLAEGAIKPWSTEKTSWERGELAKFAKARGIPLDVPYRKLTQEQRAWLWDGEEGGWRKKKWWGIRGWFKWLEGRVYKMHVRVLLSRYRAYVTCTACNGTRFKPETLKTRLAGRTISELYAGSVGSLRTFFDELRLPPALAEGTEPLLEEIRSRLRYVCDVGLEYLTLDRQSRTLSGGEMQRVNLTTAVGSALTQALFVLDEPSVGLHPRDNDRLVRILGQLVERGNTAVVVEHDPALIRGADHLIDLGPGAGENGGSILYQGPVEGAAHVPASATGRYLSGALRIPLPEHRRPVDGAALTVRGAATHNLKHVDVRFPLRALTCVTGVSGSGKSSLIEEVLYRNLLRARGKPVEDPGVCDGIEGGDAFEDVVFVDTAPIGRSPKSIVGTYLSVYERIRKLLAATPEAREAHITAATLSFNTSGGRCETCEGAGFEKVEMQFLADVHVPCADCGGARFRPEVLRARIRGKNVTEILALSLDDAAEFFAGDRELVARLQPAREVGLGYLRIGQSIVTLSGGEAQRLKLAAAIADSKKKGGRGNLYLFDEPSTGLHAADLTPLLRAFDLLVEAGHTLIVVEHAGEVIKRADYVVDLGPEAGERGGEIVASGTPEAVAAEPRSITGRYLKPLLEGKSEAEVTAESVGEGVLPPYPDLVDHSSTGEARADSGVGPRKNRTRWGAGSSQDPAGHAGAGGLKSPPGERGVAPIRVTGAHEHNLRGLSLEIAKNQLVVVTGPSGSGKSSLAFDVLFAEGQRRYLETLSPYARQFLQPLSKPEVDRIDGLPPAIAIEQRRTRGSAKTTVATLTEVWHYLRLLWTRLGVPHCPKCDQALESGSPARIANAIATRFGGTRVRFLAPVIRGKKGFHREVFEKLASEGVTQARVDKQLVATAPSPKLVRYAEHDIEAVIAEVDVPKGGGAISSELEHVLAQALDRGKGTVIVEPAGGTRSLASAAPARNRTPRLRGTAALRTEASFSTTLSCPRCGTGVPEPEPRAFSFVSPRGWCPSCKGMGFYEGFSEQLLVPDPSLSIEGGALPVLAEPPFAKKAPERFAKQVADELEVSIEKPWSKLGERARGRVLDGHDDFVGLRTRLKHMIEEAESIPPNLARYMAEATCMACGGSRLRPESRAVRVSGARLPEIAAMTASEARAWVEQLDFTGLARAVLDPIRRELVPKLAFLEQVGLGYLTLERRGDTLSGGEAQRIRLAASLGSHLTGVLYVLDEPTIGLHPVDSARLIDTLHALRDLGNTVVVVEHDEETIEAADHLVDLGPGAGTEGGLLVAQGAPAEVAKHPTSRTGRALRGEARGRRNARATPGRGGRWLELHGATENNLKGQDVRFPLGALTCVTGVSGSGKSTLVRDVLFQELRRRVSRVPVTVGAHTGLDGWEAVQRVSEVDQTPIGRNPRSTPATYTGVWDDIRKVFAATPEARARGYLPGRFSFNVRGGRCEKCEGQGVLTVEMSFLPDAKVRCDACGGKRMNGETLEVRFRGKNIADVLAMTAVEAREFFRVHELIHRALDLMCRVDLGYVALGQSSTTLSGGEAQRIKLVEELGKSSSGSSVYVLDEPTTGLAISDVASLVEVLHLLVERGDTVIVIEHHLDVIAEADWVIDLGPGGGAAGGSVVAAGSPLDLGGARKKRPSRSATAKCLAEWFARWPGMETDRRAG